MTLSAADQLAILDVITRADEAASRRDPDAYVALFTEDAVLDGTQGRHVGRKALRSGVGPIWAAEGPVTLHLTLNPVVEPGPSGDQATVRSVLLIIDPAAPPSSAPPRRSPRSSAGPAAPGASPAAPSHPRPCISS